MQLNDSIAWIQLCLDRSDGSMVTVTGSSAVVAWNVVQPCVAHAENACRFAGIAQQDNSKWAIGLHCGNHAMVVLAGHHKYVTVIGYGLKVAERVCRRAARLECSALFAVPLTNTSFALPSSLKELLGWRDTWDMCNSLQMQVSFDIYEVNPEDKSEEASGPQDTASSVVATFLC
ncbi:hypothetical protein DIPPA_51432 [Diplonema papillatum]|nr:hypothetical protein DIPPA_51432 [Diplonema papillatum]